MNKRWSIAIVGAGSAGVSAAWRLRKLLGESCQLSVYEREARVGAGRGTPSSPALESSLEARCCTPPVGIFATS